MQALYRNGVLSADVNIAGVGSNGIARDGHRLYHRVGIAFQDRAIHERARVTLIGVACYVFLIRLGVVGKLPLKACQEPSAASAPQTGLENFIDNLLPGHLGKSFAEGLVTVKCDVLIDVLRVDHTTVAQRNALLRAVKINLFKGQVCGILLGFVLIDQMLHDAAF